MPFSHHSHSGQFCGHASDTLAEVVNHAVNVRRMSVFALTEHCPRGDDDLYPGEHQSHNASSLQALYDAFVAEALRLREQVRLSAHEQGGPQCQLLIGFEAEWIRPAQSTAIVQELLAKHQGSIDFFVGSVHHVETIPIDFDKALYNKARSACGGTDHGLYSAYFDAQLEMLQTLKPRVVGHFDLIRLFSDAPDANLQTASAGTLWPVILRNLQYAKSTGAMLELNTSALRKGLAHPYPRMEICQAWLAMGGQFVLSDDSHGIAHVGTNYKKLIQFLDQLNIEALAYFSREPASGALEVKNMSMADVKSHAFWDTA